MVFNESYLERVIFRIVADKEHISFLKLSPVVHICSLCVLCNKDTFLTCGPDLDSYQNMLINVPGGSVLWFIRMKGEKL